ncbi:MAG: glycosyltransferase [Fimbriimonadaceae bacterium]|nr:glycosyltransferase [Fimbriimonadaceae bacterium]
MTTALIVSVWLLYGWLLAVATGNRLFMRRPRGMASPCFEVCVPARNEAARIGPLVESLRAQGVGVTVFDDESEDGTGDLAEAAGATVVRPAETLPPGWTGKCRACHALAEGATADWTVFLDADTVPEPTFVARVSAYLAQRGSAKVVTGFPRMIPGLGVEPAYLGWVPWSLLASNPFWLVSSTGKGHNFFLNGQFSAWRTDALQELRPFEAARGAVLEDVTIGRYLARRGVRVDVLDVSSVLSVRMYDTLPEAWEGMSKNAGEVGGGVVGSLAFAGLLLLAGWGWAFGGRFGPALYGALCLTKLLTDGVVRTPRWTAPWMPLTCTAAAFTVLRSRWLKRQGQVVWKGRRYGGRQRPSSN